MTQEGTVTEHLAPKPEVDEERRTFLERCGKFAVVTPPAITLLLSSATTPAFARGSTIGPTHPGGGHHSGGSHSGGHPPIGHHPGGNHMKKRRLRMLARKRVKKLQAMRRGRPGVRAASFRRR